MWYLYSKNLITEETWLWNNFMGATTVEDYYMGKIFMCNNLIDNLVGGKCNEYKM